MADQITEPLLVVEPGGGDGGVTSETEPVMMMEGRGQFMYHRVMSGRAFADSPDASQGNIVSCFCLEESDAVPDCVAILITR